MTAADEGGTPTPAVNANEGNKHRPSPDTASPTPESAQVRILIVRLSAIGDIVFASPLVAALRHAHPRAHIAWLVQPECAPLLHHHPDLDEVIPWPYREWRALWRGRRWRALAGAVRAFRRDLAGRGFDLALDLQGLLKSGVLTWLSGARERVGLGSREGSQWLMTRTLPRGGGPDRIGSEYLYLAEQLELPTHPFDMAVHYGAAEADRASGLIQTNGLGSGYAAICPFTTRPQKHWFASRWADLARRLNAELGLPVVMLGGPADRAAAAEVSTESGAGLVDLVGETSLLEAAALIHRAALVVAVDTGLGHMGIAFARPSLLLFGSTCPYRDTTRGNARVLYHPLPCSPCKRRPTCNGAFTCMRLIEVDEVLTAARQVMVADREVRHVGNAGAVSDEADREVRHVGNARPEMLLAAKDGGHAGNAGAVPGAHSEHVPHPCAPGAVSDEATP
jgi:heptosyltransferase-1